MSITPVSAREVNSLSSGLCPIVEYGITEFLKNAQGELRNKGEIQICNFDIVGCFPNMPKEIIRIAMRSVREKFRQFEGVYVPRFSDCQGCAWHTNKKSMQMIPFKVMLDVLDFCLDNTFIKMHGGEIKRQTEGIPMGDPLSPGMTIGTCAWLEEGWLQSVDNRDKQYFQAKRFMDDIIMIYVKNKVWDSKKFLQDFTRSEVYPKPLELEAGKDGIFLETQYYTCDNYIHYKLKNDNEMGKTNVWRYHHWHSNTTFQQKVGTLNACLRKAENASTPQLMLQSACSKVEEFRRLRYPRQVLQKACSRLGAITGNGT